MFFSANKLTGGYGGVNIIEDCSFNVNRGEIVSILGPNGAGKSTAMKAMLGILDLKNERAGNLSGGQKKLLELARTMMVDAKIVFLDEVGAGVNKTLLKDISESILKLNQDKGYTFCMIEHDFNFISDLCDPVIVLAEGSVLFKGTAQEVRKNEEVIESYLGKGLKK